MALTNTRPMQPVPRGSTHRDISNPSAPFARPLQPTAAAAERRCFHSPLTTPGRQQAGLATAASSPKPSPGKCSKPDRSQRHQIRRQHFGGRECCARTLPAVLFCPAAQYEHARCAAGPSLTHMHAYAGTSVHAPRQSPSGTPARPGKAKLLRNACLPCALLCYSCCQGQLEPERAGSAPAQERQAAPAAVPRRPVPRRPQRH